MQVYKYASYLTICVVWPCISTCHLIFLRGGGAAWGWQAWAGRPPLEGPGPVWGCLAAPAEAGFYFPPPQGSALQGEPGQRGEVAFPAAPGLPCVSVCVPEGEELTCSSSQTCSFLLCSPLLSVLWEDLLKELNASFIADFKVC